MTIRIMRWAILALGFVLFAAVSGVGANASTPEPDDHDTHHGGTPVVSICDTLSGGATSGMMMGTPGGMMHGDMPMGTPGAGMPGMAMDPDQFDLMFIDMMIPHHESAVVMAQIALERAEHEEIRQLATEIIAVQTEEIAQLQAWRDAWYPGAPAMTMEHMNAQMSAMMAGMPDMPAMAPGAMMAGMDMAAEAIALCNAPEPFDLAFIDAMIPHHESAIAMANVGLDNSTRPEMIAFHEGVIDAQQAEVNQMREWRALWYGAATPAAG